MEPKPISTRVPQDVLADVLRGYAALLAAYKVDAASAPSYAAKLERFEHMDRQANRLRSIVRRQKEKAMRITKQEGEQ